MDQEHQQFLKHLDYWQHQTLFQNVLSSFMVCKSTLSCLLFE